MTIDPKKLRQCFGTFMTGVTIVTSKDEQGNPIGFTANSFTSVSLDPPLLLVCIDKKSEQLSAYSHGDGFAINILANNQQDLSNRFAAPVGNRFDGIEWQKSNAGNPLLSDTAAYFDCSMEKTVDAGDHIIIIGRVVECDANGKMGLGYHSGQYFTLNGG